MLWPDIIYVGTTSPRDEMLTCSYIYCSAQAPRPCKLVYIIGCKRDLVTHVWLCINYGINSSHQTLNLVVITHWDTGSQQYIYAHKIYY